MNAVEKESKDAPSEYLETSEKEEVEGSPKSPNIIPSSDIIEDIGNVRSVQELLVEDPLEFSSETSSLIENIKNLMNEAESSVKCPDWNNSDPDLENSIVEALVGLILRTCFEIEEHMERLEA